MICLATCDVLFWGLMAQLYRWESRRIRECQIQLVTRSTIMSLLSTVHDKSKCAMPCKCALSSDLTQLCLSVAVCSAFCDGMHRYGVPAPFSHCRQICDNELKVCRQAFRHFFFQEKHSFFQEKHYLCMYTVHVSLYMWLTVTRYVQVWMNTCFITCFEFC